MITLKPGLFGISNTNRDFTNKESWGKNQFNSSFPASLCCYLAYKNINANYLKYNNGGIAADLISIDDLFGIPYDNSDIYFAFESLHSPFQKFVIGQLPRTDLVIQKKSSGECLVGLEVKLTALPDNSTCELNENEYGCEIVVRPDTVVYLACSIANDIFNDLGSCIPDIEVENWSEPADVLPFIHTILDALSKISEKLKFRQTPMLLQPVWKTKGKSPLLQDNCLDVFVWSNAAFVYFIKEISNKNKNANRITRQTRTAIWLFKMLSEIKTNGKFDHRVLFDNLSFNTRNDKAFSTAGNVTHKYMKSERLQKPIIKKNEIKNIILGGGQNMLSPERRFDAIIYNSNELF